MDAAPLMHTLGICTIVLVLAVLLIIGFLKVFQELLSRSMFEAPSCANEKLRED
jgi:hypothetical protein